MKALLGLFVILIMSIIATMSSTDPLNEMTVMMILFSFGAIFALMVYTLRIKVEVQKKYYV